MNIEKNKKRRRMLILVLIVAIIVAGFLTYVLRNSVRRAIYDERRAALTQLVNTATLSINNNIEAEWEIARVYENDIEVHLRKSESVEEYLSYLTSQISNEGDAYFLVDSDGKYYCSDGVNGRLNNNNKYFLDTSEKEIEYLDTLPHYKDGVTYLILRTKLDEPVRMQSENGEVEIKFCALIHDISPLVSYIESLFEGNNNTIVYDTETGLMLYKQFGIRLLIDGYNVYDKYKKVDLTYGEDGYEIIEQAKNYQSNVAMMQLKDEQFYLCTTPLNVANWSLMLVVEGSYFDEVSGQAFTGVIFSIAIMLGFIAFLIVALFTYFSRLQINQQKLKNEVEANELLTDAYQVKSNFLSYMSHDIRTPINGMIGMAKIGMNNSNDPAKVEDCFRKIDLSSKHLLALVNDVLDLSAVESGKIVITNERMDLVSTVQNCLDIIKGTLNNRDLNIEEDYACSDSIVSGDEFHLKQILINILSNAVKFTEDGGTIRVSCKQLDENNGQISYQIAISDTGCGMTEEFKEHIFEAFRTAKPSGKAKYKGSGLGMAISYEYVKLMQGTITVDSTLGEGSTFTVTLPFGKLDQTKEESDLAHLNVLLVEDNDINLEITQEMLEEHVKSIQVARDGKEAVEKFLASQQREFDLILMDIQMPIMNGYEATKAIRASDRRDNDVCIIAVTANTYKDDIDAIFEAGMNDYLNKPFDINQLIKKISKGDYKR